MSCSGNTSRMHKQCSANVNRPTPYQDPENKAAERVKLKGVEVMTPIIFVKM